MSKKTPMIICLVAFLFHHTVDTFCRRSTFKSQLTTILKLNDIDRNTVCYLLVAVNSQYKYLELKKHDVELQPNLRHVVLSWYVKIISQAAWADLKVNQRVQFRAGPQLNVKFQK